MDSKEIIKEFNAYVDGFVECCELECCDSDKRLRDILVAVAKLIEDQEERIAIMMEGNNDSELIEFGRKTIMTFPRLSGRTALMMKEALEHLKNGEPVAFMFRDKTVQCVPTVYETQKAGKKIVTMTIDRPDEPPMKPKEGDADG